MRTLQANESLRVVADARELARVAAEHVLACARERTLASGAFHLALAGGSTPRGTYAELAARTESDLGRWHLWFGDERCVPPDHRDSNFAMAASSGLPARLAPERVHRLRGESPDPAAEARRYADELCAALGSPPRLDLVLLGLGADGHTASLFPGTATLDSSDWVAVGLAPKPPAERLTLTLPTLTAARSVAFLVGGADKSSALARVLGGASELPAARVRPTAGTLLWLVERVAVEGFEPPTRGL